LQQYGIKNKSLESAQHAVPVSTACGLPLVLGPQVKENCSNQLVWFLRFGICLWVEDFLYKWQDSWSGKSIRSNLSEHNEIQYNVESHE
jgi:hypothetical protein